MVTQLNPDVNKICRPWSRSLLIEVCVVILKKTLVMKRILTSILMVCITATISSQTIDEKEQKMFITFANFTKAKELLPYKGTITDEQILKAVTNGDTLVTERDINVGYSNWFPWFEGQHKVIRYAQMVWCAKENSWDVYYFRKSNPTNEKVSPWLVTKWILAVCIICAISYFRICRFVVWKLFPATGEPVVYIKNKLLFYYMLSFMVASLIIICLYMILPDNVLFYAGFLLYSIGLSVALSFVLLFFKTLPHIYQLVKNSMKKNKVSLKM